MKINGENTHVAGERKGALTFPLTKNPASECCNPHDLEALFALCSNQVQL